MDGLLVALNDRSMAVLLCPSNSDRAQLCGVNVHCTSQINMDSIQAFNHDDHSFLRKSSKKVAAVRRPCRQFTNCSFLVLSDTQIKNAAVRLRRLYSNSFLASNTQ